MGRWSWYDFLGNNLNFVSLAIYSRVFLDKEDTRSTAAVVRHMDLDEEDTRHEKCARLMKLVDNKVLEEEHGGRLARITGLTPTTAQLLGCPADVPITPLEAFLQLGKVSRLEFNTGIHLDGTGRLFPAKLVGWHRLAPLPRGRASALWLQGDFWGFPFEPIASSALHLSGRSSAGAAHLHRFGGSFDLPAARAIETRNKLLGAFHEDKEHHWHQWNPKGSWLGENPEEAAKRLNVHDAFVLRYNTDGSALHYLLAWSKEPFWRPLQRMRVVESGSMGLIWRRLPFWVIQTEANQRKLDGHDASLDGSPDIIDKSDWKQFRLAWASAWDREQTMADLKIGKRSASSRDVWSLAGYLGEVRQGATDPWNLDRELKPDEVFSIANAGTYARLFGGPTTKNGGKTELSRWERETSDILLFRDIIVPLLVLELRAYRLKGNRYQRGKTGGIPGRQHFPYTLLKVAEDAKKPNWAEVEGDTPWHTSRRSHDRYMDATLLTWGDVVRTVNLLHPHLEWSTKQPYQHLEFVEGQYAWSGSSFLKVWDMLEANRGVGLVLEDLPFPQSVL